MEGSTPWLRSALFTSNDIVEFGSVVPVLIGLWYWRRLPKPARILVGYFAFWTVEAVVDAWSVRVLRTNIYLFHLSVLVETWLLGWLYYQALRPRVRRWLLPLGAVFTLVCLADAFWWSGLNSLNYYARSVQLVLMMALLLLFLEQWAQQINPGHPWHNFLFVVTVAEFIYYAGAGMGYLLTDKSLGSMNAVYLKGLLINSMGGVSHALLTYAIWREGRRRVAGTWPPKRRPES